jgi:hypothetical protein
MDVLEMGLLVCRDRRHPDFCHVSLLDPSRLGKGDSPGPPEELGPTGRVDPHSWNYPVHLRGDELLFWLG